MNSVKTAQHLCNQWGAVGLLVMCKDANIANSSFASKFREIKCENQELHSELLEVKLKYVGMDVVDIKLYLSCIEGLIEEILTDNTFSTIFDSCISVLYEVLIIAIRIYGKETPKERSIVEPSINIPDVFMKFVEERLAWVKKLLQKIDYHLYSDVSERTLPIFFDLLLHYSLSPLDKRCDGDIMSILSVDKRWRDEIYNRIYQLYEKIKKNEYKRAYLLLLKGINNVVYDFTVVSDRDKIIDELIDFTKFAMKISDDEVHYETISFLVKTMRACNWDPTYQQKPAMREVLKKLLSITFKIFKSNKDRPDCLALVARTVALLNVAIFDSYWKKIWGMIEDHMKKYVCAKSFETLSLIVELFCPNFINGEQLMRYILELLYEKSKDFTLPKRFEPFLKEIREFFISFANIEPDVVCNMLLNLEKVVTQTNETGPRAEFLLGIISCINPSNEGALKGLLAGIESKLNIYLNTNSPPEIIKKCLPLMVNMWTLIPRCRPTISSSVQRLVEHPDQTIATICFKSFVDMMSKAPAADFPVNVAFTMPNPILKQFTPSIRTDAFIDKVKVLTDFITALLFIFHNKPPESYVEWEYLNQRIDDALFPFLFAPDNSMRRCVRRLYSVIVQDVTFYSVAAWIASNKGKPLEKCIKEAITMRPDWFNTISSSAVVFWRNLNMSTQSDFGMSLAVPLCSILTPQTANLSEFFKDILNLFLSADIRLLASVLEALPVSVWSQFFVEFDDFYDEHIQSHRFLCLSIQYIFLTRRAFPTFKEHRKTYYATLKNFITSKRARFEREIPFEIISLNICNTIARVDDTMISKLIEDLGDVSTLIKLFMKRINPKEIFVVNPSRLFAHLDFFSGILSQVKVDSSEILGVLTYLLSIADKTMDYPEILGSIADCLNQLYSQNDKSREIIIRTALSFRDTLLNEIGTSILLNKQSDLKVSDRKHLTNELVLATSLLSSVSNITHTVGLSLAKEALFEMSNGDEEFVETFKNPLFMYDPRCESHIWYFMNKYLTDEEMDIFMSLVSSVADKIPRRFQQPYSTTKALSVFSSGSLDDFMAIFAFLAANDFKDFRAITPIIDASDKMFAKEDVDMEPILQCFLDKSTTNANSLNAAVYLFQSAFSQKPQEVAIFIRGKLGFLESLNEASTWEDVKKNSFYVIISTILSFIFANNNDQELTRELFGDIAPQLLLFALHIFDLQEFLIPLFPPLLASLLHSFSPNRDISNFKYAGKELSPTQCQYANDAIEEFDPKLAEEFRRIIIPSRADGQEMNLNFVYAIAPRFNSHDIAMLLSVVAEYALKENVGTFLRFLPFLSNALPAVAEPETIAYFIMFLISFIFENGDPRIIIAVTEQIPVITSLLEQNSKLHSVAKELTNIITKYGGADMLLSVALENLVVASSLTGPLYEACVDFLISITYLMNGGEESTISSVDVCIIILDGLWNLSGIRGRMYMNKKTGWQTGCPSVSELAKFCKNAISSEVEKRLIAQVLLHLTSKMVIQDVKFRINTATLFCQFVDDIEFIAPIDKVGEFLLVSTVCSDETIGGKYRNLLGQLIKGERALETSAHDFTHVFGSTLVYNDPDSLEVIRTISPDFYPETTIPVKPPQLSKLIPQLSI